MKEKPGQSLKQTLRQRHRSIEQAAGVVEYVDPRGRSWGVRSFRLRRIAWFSGILHVVLKITGSEKYPPRLKRIAWGEFIRRCVVNHDPYVGMLIRFRRWLGWPDYSRRVVMRRLTRKDGLVPAIVDVILRANLEYEDIVKMLDDPKKAGEGTGWTVVIGSYFTHKGIVPNDLFDFTMAQFNAVSEYMSEEQGRDKNRNWRDGALRDLRGAAGMRG